MRWDSVGGHESYAWNILTRHEFGHILLPGQGAFCHISKVQTHFGHGLACAIFLSSASLSPCASHINPLQFPEYPVFSLLSALCVLSLSAFCLLFFL